MGFISELLENDKDGTLRRGMFRIIHLVGYIAAVGLIVFVAGLSWRMFKGSDIEVFGIRVSGFEQEEDSEDETPRSPPVAVTPPAPEASKPPPPALARLSPAEHLTLTQYHNRWIAMPGDLETCIQGALEAFTKTGVAEPARTDSGVRGQFRKNSEEVHGNIRCMPLNGFTVAFIAGISTSAETAIEFVDQVRRELNTRTGGLSTERFAGTTDRQAERYSWMLTRFPDVDSCRNFADDAVGKLKPSSKTYDGPGVFAVIDGVRATVICIRQNNLISAIIAVNGFWRDDVMRIRDGLVRELTPMQRP